MVNKVFIVWCKLNKSTDKFDLGIFLEESKANRIAEQYTPVEKHTRKKYKVWVEDYKLSKAYKGKH